MVTVYSAARAHERSVRRFSRAADIEIARFYCLAFYLSRFRPHRVINATAVGNKEAEIVQLGTTRTAELLAIFFPVRRANALRRNVLLVFTFRRAGCLR